LKDSPEARGYEPVEELRVGTLSETVDKDSGEESLLDNLFQNVLSNPFIWGLAFTYFCVYVVRQGITSWSVFYLIKEKGVIDAGAAAVCFVLQNRSTVCRYWRNFQKCRYEFQV